MMQKSLGEGRSEHAVVTNHQWRLNPRYASFYTQLEIPKVGITLSEVQPVWENFQNDPCRRGLCSPEGLHN